MFLYTFYALNLHKKDYKYAITCTHLNPGTCVAIVPSLSTHDTTGGGLPCAVQLICVPVSLLKSSRDGGSCKKVGTRKPLVALTTGVGSNNIAVTIVISSNDNEVIQTKAKNKTNTTN